MVGQRCLRRKKCSQGISRLVSEGSECFTSSLYHYICSKCYSIALFNFLFPLPSLQITKRKPIKKRQVQSSHEPSHPVRLREEHGWAQVKPRNLCLSLIPAPVEVPTKGSHGFLAQFFLQRCDLTLQCCKGSGLHWTQTTKPLLDTAETVGALSTRKMKNHKDSCSIRVHKFLPLQKSCSR